VLPLILAQVEIAFEWPWNAGAQGPATAGQSIAHGSLAIGIGTATCTASYLTVLFAIKLQALEDALHSCGPAVQRDLALRLMKCLVIHGVASAGEDLEELVLGTMRTKIQASARTRPTPLQLQAMLGRLVDLTAVQQSRVPRQQLFRDLLNKHNGSASAKTRVPEQEVTAILLLDAGGQALRDLVSLAWQAEAPQYSALPMTLLNQAFLQPDAALPVWPCLT
jgi:hypothetical protein